MRNLFDFLQKQYVYFLFLFLEILSLFLFFNYNDFQENYANALTNSLSGSINSMFNNISEYFSLKKTNKILIEEITRLHSQLPEAYYRTDRKVFIKEDSVKLIEYKFISAKVISNSTNKRNNFLMIEKGKIHGINEHMGVIFGNRIVGQVISVSPHFSWIMSMLNKDSRISGKFKKNNQLVNVEWNGRNYRIGQITEIPKHIVIRKNDTIITSGNSDLFPEGLLIGTVEKFTITKDENFNEADILFSTDFNCLDYVEVIIDGLRKEKSKLQKSFSFPQTGNE